MSAELQSCVRWLTWVVSPPSCSRGIGMRNKLVAGNWKMFGSLAENQTRLTQLAGAQLGKNKADIAVIPPFPYLAQCKSLLSPAGISTGAQNVSDHAEGAFTGEVSVSMLRDFGCRYILVGHSERRSIFGESDTQVAQKFQRAQNGGLTPILCVGETLDEREADLTEQVVQQQIQAVLDLVGIQAFSNAVVAYEPVWAIGTGRTASPEQAQAVHQAIRSQLAELDSGVAANTQILYGGSVKANNAQSIFAQPDVDGALVGGASLIADDFIQICKAAG